MASPPLRRANARALAPGGGCAASGAHDDVIVIPDQEDADGEAEVIEIDDGPTSAPTSAPSPAQGRAGKRRRRGGARDRPCADEALARALADEDAARCARQLQMAEYAQPSPGKRAKAAEAAALAQQRGGPRGHDEDRAARERISAVERLLDQGIVPARLRLHGGGPLLLNRLAGHCDAARAQDAVGSLLPTEVSNEDLYWHQPFLQAALLASYGVQYDLVERMILRSPAAMRPGGVLVCDNYNHDTQDAGFAVRHTHTVVLPPFFDRAANTSVRARFEKGTMHPKLQLLEFDGGNDQARFLRLIIGSANLGDYDKSINNQFWAHDFPLQTGSACDSKTAAAFKRDLGAFISALLRPLANATEHQQWAPALPAQWLARLDKYDVSSLPPATHLILSVPGRYEGDERLAYGHLALRRHLCEGLAGRSAENRPTRIEFATSSVGRLTRGGFRSCFFRSLRTGAVGGEAAPVLHVFPSIGQRMAISQACIHILKRPKACAQADSRLTCATACQAGGEQKALEEHEDAGHMRGPADWFDEAFPRDCWAHHDVPPAWRHRATAAHHTKIFAGLTADSQLVWQASGSHNFSGAAWGMFEESSFVVMSYELSVSTYLPVYMHACLETQCTEALLRFPPPTEAQCATSTCPHRASALRVATRCEWQPSLRGGVATRSAWHRCVTLHSVLNTKERGSSECRSFCTKSEREGCGHVLPAVGTLLSACTHTCARD